MASRSVMCKTDGWRHRLGAALLSAILLRSHDVGQAIAAVRDWLRTNHPTRIGIPGAKRMQQRYVQFRLELPAVARAANLDVQELNFLATGRW